MARWLCCSIKVLSRQYMDSHWIWADTYHVFEECGKVKHLLCKAVERFSDT